MTGAPTDRSHRVDPRTGALETAGWDDGIFGVTHTPAGPAKATVVMCSPLLAEFQRNYRREVIAARALVEVGFAVRRFHYRGTGNSDHLIPTFDTMVAEAAAIAAAADGEVVLMGTRSGALVAGAVADRISPHRLVLWEPVASGKRFLDEVLRASAIGAVGEGEATDPSATLTAQGWIDALGERLEARTAESLMDIEMVLPDPPPETLICHIGRPDRPRRDLMALVELPGVALRTIEGREVWWANAGGDDIHRSAESEPITVGLVDATLSWLGGAR